MATAGRMRRGRYSPRSPASREQCGHVRCWHQQAQRCHDPSAGGGGYPQRRGDADDFLTVVEHRAAAVARGERRVGLDPRHAVDVGDARVGAGGERQGVAADPWIAEGGDLLAGSQLLGGQRQRPKLRRRPRRPPAVPNLGLVLRA